MKRYWITPEDAAKFTLDHLNSPKGVYFPKMMFMTLGELADKIAPNAERIIIGNRGNEKVEEILEQKNNKEASSVTRIMPECFTPSKCD